MLSSLVDTHWPSVIKSGIVFLVGFIFETEDLQKEGLDVLCWVLIFLAKYFLMGNTLSHIKGIATRAFFRLSRD